MDLIKNLSELYDPLDYLPPKKRGFALCAYDSMFSKNNEFRQFILDYIPIGCIPRRFHKQAKYLDLIIRCFELLCRNPNDYSDSFDDFFYNSIIEMLTEGDIMPPETFYDDLPVGSIDAAITNFNKYFILYRFFNNKGQVLFSYNMKLVGLKYAKYVGEGVLLSRYFDMLESDHVLRKAKQPELKLVLKAYKRTELEELYSITYPNHSKGLAGLMKSEIIEHLFNDKELQDTPLVDSFYVLSDDFQKFKVWLVEERPYFRVYSLFKSTVRKAMHDFGSVMKDLIIVNKDYLTAKRVGDLYNRIRESNDFIEVGGNDLGQDSVDIQMKKIEKHFKLDKL